MVQGGRSNLKLDLPKNQVLSGVDLTHNYRPQRSCGQGYVFTRVCDSVHGVGGWGGSASVHAGIPTREADPSPEADPPPKQTPREADPPPKQALPPQEAGPPPAYGQ